MGPVVNSTTLSNMQALIPAVNTAVEADFPDMTIGVLSMKNESGSVVTSHTAEGSWATQRRRLSRLRT